jgi:hypothetical protein
MVTASAAESDPGTPTGASVPYTDVTYDGRALAAAHRGRVIDAESVDHAE